MTDEDAILAAHAAYYSAFGNGDFAAMERVWADDDVSCVHPGWPTLIGRDAVLESYRNILRNPQRERIGHRDDAAMVLGNEGRVLCVEVVVGTDYMLAATNWFRRIDGAWRMIHHQASPIASYLTDTAPASPSQRLN